MTDESSGSGPSGIDRAGPDDGDDDVAADASAEPDGDALSDAEAAIADARRRLAEVPADVVVTNHAMGLYELAAIHLSAEEPDLDSASLAIDAMAALVERLGERLGAETATLRTALSNIQMVFVQLKTHAGAASGASGSAGEATVPPDGAESAGGGGSGAGG